MSQKEFRASVRHRETFSIGRLKKNADMDDMARQLAKKFSNDLKSPIVTKRNTLEEDKEHSYDFYLEKKGLIHRSHEFLFSAKMKLRKKETPECGAKFVIKAKKNGEMHIVAAKDFIMKYSAA